MPNFLEIRSVNAKMETNKAPEEPVVPAEAQAEEDLEPEYPPETHRWMSWAAIKFINRPTLRPLAWVCYALMAIVAAGLVSIFYIRLDVRVESRGEIVADPGVLQVLARADELMTVPRISAGSTVAKGAVLGVLQMPVHGHFS